MYESNATENTNQSDLLFDPRNQELCNRQLCHLSPAVFYLNGPVWVLSPAAADASQECYVASSRSPLFFLDGDAQRDFPLIHRQADPTGAAAPGSAVPRSGRSEALLPEVPAGRVGVASRRTRKWRPAGGAAVATLERSVEVALARGGGAAAADPGRVQRSPANAGRVAEVRQVCPPFVSCPTPGSVSAAEARGPFSANGAPLSRFGPAGTTPGVEAAG
ncbi:uncharacterized protein LOC116104603 [Mastomys coucha]|uniref:uncharacterized protein LOC116104603 n=1 Tax=Mastomys coucha TaxID=35658 RepID=UPI0012619F6D|nr:uncharacterized protein LOC116104603 [Mastomys coucha]